MDRSFTPVDSVVPVDLKANQDARRAAVSFIQMTYEEQKLLEEHGVDWWVYGKIY